MQPLAALLQLADRLRSAQHQHAEQREFPARKRQRLVEQMAVLECPAARAAREPGPAAVRESVEGGLDLSLLEGHHRIAIRRLVASEPKKVQKQRIRVENRALLLDQTAQNTDLDGIGVHRRDRLEANPRLGDRRGRPAHDDGRQAPARDEAC